MSTLPAEPRRLLIAGDVHGNGPWLESLCRTASQLDCDAVLQLGDFGYWPHVPGGRRFLQCVSKYAERAGIVVYWIDGNHENHDELGRLRPSADGLVDVVDRCRYIPRGHRWTWSGVRFGALGGAFSIDWRDRTPGTSWWPDEVTSAADVERLGPDPLDVLITHEAPAGVPLVGFRLPASDQVRTDEVRGLVAEAVQSTSPALVLHGHWHHRHSSELAWPREADGELRWAHTQVEGLAADVQHDARAWGVLDLAPLRFTGGEAQASTECYSVHMTRTQGSEAARDLAGAIESLNAGVTAARASDERADLVLSTRDGGQWIVEVKSLRSPALADVARLGRGDTESVRKVLVADRLVPRVRSELAESGWGWLDRSGHLFLRAPGLVIDTDVPALSPVRGRARPTLDTDVGLDVAAALLTQPHERLSVRRLVDFTGRSLGAVHHARRGLVEAGLLGSDGRPLVPELFWEVAARWRAVRIPLARAPKFGESDDGDQSGGWVLCETLAANAYGAGAVVRGDHPPDFYVPDERSVRVARQLLGDPTTVEHRGATVAIAPVGWVCQHRVDLRSMSRKRAASWAAAHPVVVALDLSTDAGRGREILDGWSPPPPFERVW